MFKVTAGEFGNLLSHLPLLKENMWIKGIELVNFQKHEKFKANFTSKVNVLLGETDAGKSAIVRAFKWIMYNRGDDIRKHNTDITRVRILLDNGTIIEREKSDTVNAYILIKDSEEKRYDAIGKTVPEDIVKELGIVPMAVDKEQLILNISPQISLPFLLDSPATFRMKVFNKLTGNDILDAVSQSYNKDILAISRESKMLLADVSEKMGTLDDITAELDQIKGKLGDAKEAYAKAKARNSTYFDIAELRDWMVAYEKDSRQLEDDIAKIKIPDKLTLVGLKGRIEVFSIVKGLAEQIKSFDKEIRAIHKKLDSIKWPDNLLSVKKSIERYGNAAQLVGKVKEINKVYVDIEKDIKRITGEVQKNTEEYKSILKEYQRCPTCHSKITDEILKEIEL